MTRASSAASARLSDKVLEARAARSARGRAGLRPLPDLRRVPRPRRAGWSPRRRSSSRPITSASRSSRSGGVWEQWTAFPLQPRQRAAGGLQRFAGAGRRRLDLVQALRQTRRAPRGARCWFPTAATCPAHFDDGAAFTTCRRLTSVHAAALRRASSSTCRRSIDTLDWVWRERISHVELSTPGPMGLVGLLVAKVLRLPVTASYHTEVPALIRPLGGNALHGARGAPLPGLVLRARRSRLRVLVAARATR